MVILAKDLPTSRNNSGHGGGAAGGALPTESHPLEVGWLEREGRNRLAPRDNFLPSALISIQQDEMGASER